MSEPRHPPRAELLACVDGELGRWRGWQVRAHLARCWSCRAHVAQLEAAIASVSQALPPAQVTPIDLARARWKFREGVSTVERTIEERERLLPLLRFAAVVAGLALWSIFLLRTRATAPSDPGTSTTLQTAIAAETPAVVRAVRDERFSVRYSREGAPSVERGLHLLQAPRQGAWTARWSDETGRLRNAVFANARDSREYSLGAGLRPAVFDRAEPYEGLFLHAAAATDVDGAVLAWIRRQAWRPVSLAREVAEFCSRSGAVLTLTSDGQAVLWTAASTVDRVRFEVHLEGRHGQPPAVLRIRWTSGGARGVLEIRREDRRDYDDVMLAAPWLHPPATVQGMPSGAPRVAPPEEAAVFAGPPLSDVLDSEVAVLHALHALRMCKTDEVHVARHPRAVVVEGVLVSDEDAERVRAAVSGIPHVRTDVKVAAFSDGGPAVVTPTQQEQSIRPAAAEPWLRARLGVGTRASERDMFNTMNAVVSDSEELLSDSWMLVRLSERFPPSVEDVLSDRARQQLFAMVDDHLVALNIRLAAIEARLALQPSPEGSVAASKAGAWQPALTAVHRHARTAAEMLLSVFAAGDPASRAASSDPEQIGIASLIRTTRTAALATRTELRERAALASH